jgi:glycosyltransferase involved in cell wall biosynthesis
MRILHVQKASGIGGSERHLLMLLPALAERGHEVRMCVPLAAGGETFVEELRARGIATATAPAGPDLNPRLIGWLRREIERYGPDVVHTHLVHADLHGLASARLTGTPRLSTVHGPGAFSRSAPYRLATRLVGALAPLTIAISHHVRRALEESRQRRRGSVRVVHYGIDPVGWVASPGSRTKLRHSFGIAPGEVAVAICSRLIPGKGHGLLLDAVAATLRRAPAVRLLIAGEGPLRGSLERKACELPTGTVRFLGFVDEVRPLMQASDLLAFPTSPRLGEGFGLAALEAMAAERPVVATDVGALPEVVESGETGILVPPEDAAALTDALVALASKPALREAMGRRGRERAMREFGIDTMVDRTLTAYGEAVARR